MRPIPLVLVILLLAAPAAGAKEVPRPEYPSELLALLPRWIADAERAGGPPEALEYLAKARGAADEGRFRVALFHLDTHRQHLEAGRLLDEAGEGGLPARKERVLALADAWRAEAGDAWERYRAALREYEGVKSLHAAELALYSADHALLAAVQLTTVDEVKASLRGSDRLDEGLVAALARSTRGVTYQLGLARDVLDVAAGTEGVPPRLDEASWDRTLEEASRVPEGEPPYYLQRLESIAGDARTTGERLLALALHLAQLRDGRVAAIQQQFGDAAARGIDATRDAGVGMTRGAENLSMEDARADALLGVFTADALDRVLYTAPLARDGAIGLPTASFAWASLDHQAAANLVLAEARERPVVAGEKDEKDAPLPGAALAALALAAAAAVLALRRGRA